MTSPTDVIRPRRSVDLAALTDVLAEQQPTSHYPFRWPLPFPVREFIERPGELMAWVATRDEVPVGHVCVQRPAGSAGTNGVADHELTRVWSAAHQRPAADLAVVSALFTATTTRGSGLGGRLLDTAVGWIREQGLAPCLDVLQGPSPAADIYRARGWRVAGELRPDWLPEDQPPLLAMVLPGENPSTERPAER